jgi:16S rRNA (guanine527-N7)-methyltransferase
VDTLKTGAAKLGLDLTPDQLEMFQAYYRSIVEWNQQVNLTAITDFEEVQTRHFLDSLTIATVMKRPTGSLHVVDIGSGAGLPGIPLKIVFPDLELVLIDSVGKKTAFLNHIVDKLGLNKVEVVNGRAEDVAHDPRYREWAHMALGRAVAKLPVLLELTLPFCSVGGKVVAQKKGDVYQEVEGAANAIRLLGGRLIEIKPLDPELMSDQRYLVIVEKMRPTAVGFPRRAGLPAKHPL